MHPILRSSLVFKAPSSSKSSHLYKTHPRHRFSSSTLTTPLSRYHHQSKPFKMPISTDSHLRTFFQSPKFAVVGASTNPAKYGYKVFAWYLAHSLPATPINPSGAPIEINGTSYPVVKSLDEIPDPAETSVSFITPPAVTLKSLKQAKELGVKCVFLQPGTFDDEVLEFAWGNFKSVLAGAEGDTRGGEGWCVLVDGERGLKGIGKL
ncbi:CoA binding domain-containing protein [Podospora fimiseda]|uniref:CoA binding domain-containing protein n=1 Tax=Podospora fimiseda TaxID=252190 RepID=A0AAN7BNP2_9PEZI|nr:CoA binding domain-containing protein [Podospora fimiseda]